MTQSHSDSEKCQSMCNLLRPTGILSKVLHKQISHIKIPVVSNPSSSAKVITSKANWKKMKEKEEKRVAEVTRKEQDKNRGERKQEEKNEIKKKQQQQRMEAWLKKIDEFHVYIYTCFDI